jgi:hypothetical protein
MAPRPTTITLCIMPGIVRMPRPIATADAGGGDVVRRDGS